MGKEKNFFKGVTIKNEAIQESILHWILRLKKEDILISKFSSLFSQYPKIEFPIKISGIPRHLEIEDANGNHFYFSYNQYTNITQYSIGKRDNNYDTEFSFHLKGKSNIFLNSLSIIALDKNGINTDKHIMFTYNYIYSSTKAVLEVKVNKELISIEISYDSASIEQDFNVSTYLFELSNKSKQISNACITSDKLCADIPKLLEPQEISSIYYSKKIAISPNNN